MSRCCHRSSGVATALCNPSLSLCDRSYCHLTPLSGPWRLVSPSWTNYRRAGDRHWAVDHLWDEAIWPTVFAHFESIMKLIHSEVIHEEGTRIGPAHRGCGEPHSLPTNTRLHASYMSLSHFQRSPPSPCASAESRPGLWRCKCGHCGSARRQCERKALQCDDKMRHQTKAGEGLSYLGGLGLTRSRKMTSELHSADRAIMLIPSNTHVCIRMPVDNFKAAVVISHVPS